MSRVLVTPRSATQGNHQALARLGAAGLDVVFCRSGSQPTEDELVSLLPGCVGYLAGVEPITARALAAADVLRVISRNGTGIDNIDLPAARSKGVSVCRAEAANARGVAELAMAHILGAVRSVAWSDRAMKAGGWERRRGVELAGRTLGLVGCGAVGRIVARLALAFDMRVLACDPLLEDSFAPSPLFERASFDRLLAEADVLTLHCPALGDRPLIDREAVSRLKPGTYLVNTARAALLDEGAVLGGLESGRIAGVALDVFETEPPRDRRLIEHPLVVATPHAGGLTEESLARALTVAVDNLLGALSA
jgi:phosphoglycerate dehydrogenase-like enzyme